MRSNIDIFELPTSMQIMIIAIICVVVLALAYFFDFSTKTLQISGANQQETTLKLQYEESLKQEAKLQNDVSNLPLIKKMLATWQDKLVKPAEMPDVLNQILKIGAANQLQFNLFSPQAVQPDHGFNKIPIKVSVLGNYHEIASFISQVANMPWIISVNYFTIGRTKVINPGDKADSRLTADILLEVYYLDTK